MAERDLFFIASAGLAILIAYALARKGSIVLPALFDGGDVPATDNPYPDNFYIPDYSNGSAMTLQPSMSLSQSGTDLIKQFEGFSANPYPDAGKISIGYGHQIKPGENIPGPITREEADVIFSSDVQWATKAVNDWVSVPLTQGQFDALVSLVYNIGASAFHLSTLLSKLNSGDYQGAADEFKRWNKSAEQFSPVLAARREAELNVWYA